MHKMSKTSGAAEYQKGWNSTIRSLMLSLELLTKYHRSPNITTREIMKVINTRIWPRGV